MKITETITRECCTQGDMVDYKAAYPRSYPLPPGLCFCKHCGRWWTSVAQIDPAGNSSKALRPVLVKDWEIKD